MQYPQEKLLQHTNEANDELWRENCRLRSELVQKQIHLETAEHAKKDAKRQAKRLFRKMEEVTLEHIRKKLAEEDAKRPRGRRNTSDSSCFSAQLPGQWARRAWGVRIPFKRCQDLQHHPRDRREGSCRRSTSNQ